MYLYMKTRESSFFFCICLMHQMTRRGFWISFRSPVLRGPPSPSVASVQIETLKEFFTARKAALNEPVSDLMHVINLIHMVCFIYQVYFTL